MTTAFIPANPNYGIEDYRCAFDPNGDRSDWGQKIWTWYADTSGEEALII